MTVKAEKDTGIQTKLSELINHIQGNNIIGIDA